MLLSWKITYKFFKYMINIYINNIKIKVKKNTTVLQACQNLNIIIPKFCFQKNLKIAGNCRMCLVEVENSPKPLASCALPVLDNMKIFTESVLIKKARENILEFLLINHPLDCPICDEGSQCDLQDQALIFGSDKSRFFFEKRIVENKNWGPFIKTIMTRCIHCTRCVRFSQDITNIDNLGIVGRGNKMEISFYLSNIFKSEYSGNLIDLCPVGALTSKPFAFRARSWELQSRVSIDSSNSFNRSLQLETLNNEVVRVLPTIKNEDITEFISDKSRFFYDSLKIQRLEIPLLKNKNIFKNISLEHIFLILNKKLSYIDSSQIQSHAGNLIDLKSLYIYKKFLNIFGIKNNNFFSKNNNFLINSIIPNNFIINNLYTDLEKSNICLLINFNPKTENSSLNLKLHELSNEKNLKIFSIGPKINTSYKITSLGLSLKNFKEIYNGQHEFCKKFNIKTKVCLLIGSNTYNIKNNVFLFEKFVKITKKIHIIQTESSFLNFVEINPQKIKKMNQNKLLFLYNTHNTLSSIDYKNTFIIYFGHHFTNDAAKANLIIPFCTIYEKQIFNFTNFGKLVKKEKILQTTDQNQNDYNFVINFLTYKNTINTNFLKAQKIKKILKLFKYLINQNLKLIKCKTEIRNNINFKFFNYLNNKIINYWQHTILEKNSKILSKTNNFLKNNTNFKKY